MNIAKRGERESTPFGEESGPKPLLEAQFEEGLLLEGRYQVVRLIGRGGMGEVYAARQLRLQREVALKTLRREFAANTRMAKRFERESRAAARLVSEHVVVVFDSGSAPDGTPFFVMEYLEGMDWRALLRGEGTLTAPRAVRLALDVCEGLEVAHRAGVLHRDLKPENVFVMRRGGREFCKIVDFGLAKLKDAALSTETRDGVPIGTLHYMSPEQARGDKNVDARTDVYSVCAILYEALSGRCPHEAESSHALLYQIIHERPPPVHEVCSLLPPGLAAIVDRGLEKDPALRPASAAMLGALLEPYAARSAPSSGVGSDEADDDRPTPVGEETLAATKATLPFREGARSNASRVAIAGLALVLVTALGFWSGARLQSHAPPAGVERESRVIPPAAPVVPPPAVVSTPAPAVPSSSAPRLVPSRDAPAHPRRAAGVQPSTSRSSTRPSASGGTEFDRSNPYE